MELNVNSEKYEYPFIKMLMLVSLNTSFHIYTTICYRNSWTFKMIDKNVMCYKLNNSRSSNPIQKSRTWEQGFESTTLTKRFQKITKMPQVTI